MGTTKLQYNCLHMRWITDPPEIVKIFLLGGIKAYELTSCILDSFLPQPSTSSVSRR